MKDHDRRSRYSELAKRGPGSAATVEWLPAASGHGPIVADDDEAGPTAEWLVAVVRTDVPAPESSPAEWMPPANEGQAPAPPAGQPADFVPELAKADAAAAVAASSAPAVASWRSSAPAAISGRCDRIKGDATRWAEEMRARAARLEARLDALEAPDSGRATSTPER